LARYPHGGRAADHLGVGDGGRPRQKITANGPPAVAATKRIIAESRGWSPEDMWAKQTRILMPVFSSDDAKEGAIAFAEKRPPKWTGT
jgi:enoyl-CoA hydratase/carnithine racemase